MPGPTTIQVELVELSLASVEPITVQDSAGAVDSFFDAFVELSPEPPSEGYMTIEKTMDDTGGKYCVNNSPEGGIEVYARFVFFEAWPSRMLGTMSNGAPLIWDPCLPVVLKMAKKKAWQTAEPEEACILEQGFYPVPQETLMLLDDGATGELTVVPQGTGGGWQPSDPFKMHFPQLPDPNGWDVYDVSTLADDWRCTETGPVTDIHFWYSWQHGIVGQIQWVDVSIWSDDPCGPAGYSQPSDQLWARRFFSGQFTPRWAGEGNQGWFEPLTARARRPDHNDYYRIDIEDINDPFIQQEGDIYWLSVQTAESLTVPGTAGWKTSLNHWNDNAVYLDLQVVPPLWRELDDPCTGDIIDLAFVITSGVQEADFGDAPEGAPAYPPTIVVGAFPTCKTVGPATWAEHTLGWAYFSRPVLPAPQAPWDAELDGNGGLCPNCFPPYDADECFRDGDAGLMYPEPYTIDSTYTVVTCPQSGGTALGTTCRTAVWGQDIDIYVVNNATTDAYVNVLMDWTQDGWWAGAANCIVAGAPEHVLVDFPVPVGYSGTLSALMPFGAGFLIGPYPGYVWARFTITDVPVNDRDWNGEGTFKIGETEDYLLRVDTEEELDFGDAPDPTYPTLLANNGARHKVAARMYLGSSVDVEANGQPHPNALGDDNDGNDDEDGVVFTSALMPGQWATIDVNANVQGYLDAWVDFGGDGGWTEPADHIFAAQPLNAGINPLSFWVPFGARPGNTFARFRFSSVGGLWHVGLAPNGEVEDYEVEIQENPKIKWLQLPDTTPNGVDIRVDNMRWLADDFECTTYGPITDVHLWGSWLYDYKGWITRIHLSIHSNDPCGINGYSEPDELLWERDFFAGEFEEALIRDLLYAGEYWWDPLEGMLIPNGDSQIWRIDIHIDPCDAFIQEGDPCNPVIYWLDVQVDAYPGQFGWKTRRFPHHYMDDAVWDYGSELPRIWKELRYPKGHPYHPNSIDMAFVITGEEALRPKPAIPNLKWSQPPIEIDPTASVPTYCGWDVMTFRKNIEFSCWAWPPTQCHGDADADWYVGFSDLQILMDANGTTWPETDYNPCADFSRDLNVDEDDLDIMKAYWFTNPPPNCPPGAGPDGPGWWGLVADDFRCLGFMPVTSVHWWGSHVGWNHTEPPPEQPDAWRVSFWTNVPAGADVEFSHPEELLWQIQVPTERIEWQWVGDDYFPDKPPETCFQYYVDLEPEEYFWQGDFEPNTIDDIFWLSVTAIYYDPCEPNYPWGWKTRPWSWMDDAVTFELYGTFKPPIKLDPLYAYYMSPIIAYGESYDTAFELDTDPNWVKWEQPFTGIRRWPHYEDELSMAYEDEGGALNIRRLVADDWPCDQNTPVTALVWWGSYIGYRYEACRPTIIAPPVRPDYFLLQIWNDVPAGVDLTYSHPNNVIWKYRAYDYDEVLVGYDKHPLGSTGPLREPVFRYSVRLPKDAWFRQRHVKDIYWLSVTAVYKYGTDPLYDWGWTNHRYVASDDAVAGYVTPSDPPLWKWEELFDQTGVSEDMSFILFTWPWPPCWGYLTQCHGDADGDGWVKGSDFLALKNSWYKCYPDPLYDPCADFDRNGCVKGSDFLILKTHWYTSPPPDCPRGAKWPP
jgi:hypothetical protein